MKESCLFPNCEEHTKTRGLCALHYQYAYRLVKRGHTTWADLETQEKAKPRTRISSDVNKWFLDNPDQRLLEKDE